MSSLPAPAPQKDGQPPCKVVLTGAEGQDPAAIGALARRLSGVISRFYNSSRQNSDNSQGDVWHAHRALPAGLGKLHYSSNQGMETMRIELNPSEVPEFQQQYREEIKPTVPQFCVVDFVVPGGDNIAQADFIAVGVLPERWAGEWETDSVNWFDESEEPLAEGEKRIPFRFARDVEPIDFEVAITNRVASLKFDMRDYSDNEIFEVDLYGKVRPEEFDIVGYGDTSYSRTLTFDNRGLPLASREVARIDWTLYDSASAPGMVSHPKHTIPAGHGPIFSNGGQIGDGRYPASEAFIQSYPGAGNYVYEYHPASGLIIRETIYHIWDGSYEGYTARRCPEHTEFTRNVGSRRNYDWITWSERRWEVTENPGGPIRSEEFDTQADVVYGFYDNPDMEWKVGRTEHQDVRHGGPGGAVDSWPCIWSKDLDAPTERKALGVKAPMQYTPVPGNPSNYAKMGTLTIDRAARRVTFVPG